MKLAIPYENGEIFQHFGKCETFKIYEVQDGTVVSSELIHTSGQGHDAVAEALVAADVAAVMCGGIGEGAVNALNAAGVHVFTGYTGSADEAVEDFLNGAPMPGSANCNCGGDGEGCDCGGDCGGGCGGCGGGCGGRMTPLFEGKNVMKTCRVHYCGTFNDGTQFDSSYDRGEPLEFVCGVGMMIPGFDRAVGDMEVGEVKDIHLMPEEAYGEADPNMIVTFEIAKLGGSEALEVGQRVALSGPMGQPIPVTVIEKTETTITMDANHEMAGKELNFRIELVSVTEA